jgi:hypothetical protein
MKKIIFWVTGCLFIYACQSSSDNSQTEGAKTAVTAPVEFTDSTFIIIGDKALSDFKKGNFDSFISIYTDDTHLDLADGDSVMGKANVLNFWKSRMTGVDSIHFNTPIYLPIKVNESKQVQTGNYLLMWYNFTLYLKNGKKLTGHTHDVVHFTTDKKIDYQMHFTDNAPIIAAMKTN